MLRACSNSSDTGDTLRITWRSFRCDMGAAQGSKCVQCRDLLQAKGLRKKMAFNYVILTLSGGFLPS